MRFCWEGVVCGEGQWGCGEDSKCMLSWNSILQLYHLRSSADLLMTDAFVAVVLVGWGCDCRLLLWLTFSQGPLR